MTKHICLLSDSTGDLGDRILKALVSQFPKDSFRIQVFRFINTDEDLNKTFRKIKTLKPILFHTTINRSHKKKITDIAKKNKWPCFDLTGSAMTFLEKASGLKSQRNPELLHELDQEYDKRISALSFTVEHDDGLDPTRWDQADIVLLGVSRTSKTPTSIYLANKGYKVANVPLVKGVPIPERLRKAPRLNMVGLVINPDKLKDIRRTRAKQDKNPGASYTSLEDIKEELKEAHNLFLELNIPIIDVTNHAVEEVAALVQKHLSLS